MSSLARSVEDQMTTDVAEAQAEYAMERKEATASWADPMRQNGQSFGP